MSDIDLQKVNFGQTSAELTKNYVLIKIVIVQLTILFNMESPWNAVV